jgi:hypothetical protein
MFLAIILRDSIAIFLCLISAICFLTSCLAQGIHDLSKHLHLSSLSFNMCLILFMPTMISYFVSKLCYLHSEGNAI